MIYKKIHIIWINSALDWSELLKNQSGCGLLKFTLTFRLKVNINCILILFYNFGKWMLRGTLIWKKIIRFFVVQIRIRTRPIRLRNPGPLYPNDFRWIPDTADTRIFLLLRQHDDLSNLIYEVKICYMDPTSQKNGVRMIYPPARESHLLFLSRSVLMFFKNQVQVFWPTLEVPDI